MIKTKSPVLKIYVKGKKKPFAEMELTDESQIDDFFNLLSDDNRYIKYGPIILSKSEFRCAVLNN